MRAARHVSRLILDTVLYGIVGRKVALLVLVALGLVAIALASTAQAAAPVLLYPFI